MGKRVAIVGGPRTGKTTLAGSGADVLHTDDLIPLGWSEAAVEVARKLDDPGTRVVEGVQTARGLRKWLEAHPTGRPVDEVVYLTRPVVERTKGHETMSKGIDTVMREIEPELVRRGVTITKMEEPNR